MPLLLTTERLLVAPVVVVQSQLATAIGMWFQMKLLAAATRHYAIDHGQKNWGITIDKPEYTITLTCDKDGNLS